MRGGINLLVQKNQWQSYNAQRMGRQQHLGHRKAEIYGPSEGLPLGSADMTSRAHFAAPFFTASKPALPCSHPCAHTAAQSPRTPSIESGETASAAESPCPANGSRTTPSPSARHWPGFSWSRKRRWRFRLLY